MLGFLYLILDTLFLIAITLTGVMSSLFLLASNWVNRDNLQGSFAAAVLVETFVILSLTLGYAGALFGLIEVGQPAALLFGAAVVALFLFVPVSQTLTHKAIFDCKQAERDRLDLLRQQDQFSNLAAHELRTPLTLINGLSELLQVGAIGQLTDDQRDAIKIINERGTGLQGIVESLVLMIRQPQPDPIDATATIDALVTAWQIRGEINGVAVEYRHKPKDRVIVKVDPKMFRGAVDALLSNAVKFSNNGDRVTVDVKIRQLGEVVNLEISDTGIGIDPKRIGKIFEPYAQLEKPETRSRGGIGVGLAVVDRFILLHNGSIRVASEIGEGSTFVLSLPVAGIIEDK